MDPVKLEREVLILQRCNSETVALNRALDGDRRRAARRPVAAPPRVAVIGAVPGEAGQRATAAASHAR